MQILHTFAALNNSSMKKRDFFTIVIAAALAACNGGDNSTHPAEEPTAAIGTETAAPVAVTTIQWLDSTIDKGTINEGEKLEIVYRFKNTGNKPLIIKSAKGSCGCTVPEKPDAPIAAGKEGFIKATFDSNNRPGPNHKTVTVEANTEPAIHNLSFNVVVNKKS